MSSARMYRRDSAPAALTNNFNEGEDAYWEDEDFYDEPEELPDFEKKKDTPSLSRGIAIPSPQPAPSPSKSPQGDQFKKVEKEALTVAAAVVEKSPAVSPRATTPARNDSKA